jgi:hypothetical protein
VTIAACDIRYVVFDRLDPLANAANQTRLCGGQWEWTAPPDGACFGRLTVVPRVTPGKAAAPAARALAALELPLHGWTPTGAQLLSFAVRADKGAHFAVVFRTETGGTFLFGDRPMAGHMARATGAYFIHPQYRVAGEWHVLTLPFHDLAWRRGAAPGGPMPNHPLASVTILCVANPGSGIDIGQMTFLRPRAISMSQESGRGFCVGGSLTSFAGRETVCLAAQAPGTAVPRTVMVDQCGHFCFDGVAPSVYRVWSPSLLGDIIDRRGLLVEVGGDVTNLVFDRRLNKID